MVHASLSLPSRPETPLVLLAGLLCDETVWQAQASSLEGFADVHVRCFQHQRTIEQMAEFVLDTCPPVFALAGHSMGGRVALEVVRRAPQRVQKLALLNTGIHTVRPGEAEKRQVLIDLAFRAGMETLANEWLPPMLSEHRLQDSALIDELTQMVCRSTPQIFEQQVRALLTRPDPRSFLPDIACRTFLASGTHDRWSPLSQHEEMAALIPGSRVIAIENSGHMSLSEQPAAVTDLLRVLL